VLGGVQVKVPVFAVLATIVETVFRLVESPCFKSSVTVPEDVGLQVITLGVPAVKPEDNWVALRVNGFACAETKAAIAAKTMEVVNCIVIALF